MQLIECSEFRDESGEIGLENLVRGSLEFGFGWRKEMQAQDFVTEHLAKSLNDDHVLIRNINLPGTDILVPMILLSPQGARVLHATPKRGVFRAKGEEWMVFDGRNRRFKRVRPNLQTPVLLWAQAVLHFLKEKGYPLPDIEAVLVFTNHRTLIDTARPRTRIVMADAISHFASNLQKLQPIMNQEDIHELSEALIHPKLPEPEPLIPDQAPFDSAIEPGIQPGLTPPFQTPPEPGFSPSQDPFQPISQPGYATELEPFAPPSQEIDQPYEQPPFDQMYTSPEEDEYQAFRNASFAPMSPDFSEPQATGLLGFTRKQWLVLAGLVILEIIVLAALVLLIVKSFF